jgi:hypothetical protein
LGESIVKITATLILMPAPDGEPRAHLKLKLGDDVYHMLNGESVRDWEPGAIVEHVVTIDVARISNVR